MAATSTSATAWAGHQLLHDPGSDGKTWKKEKNKKQKQVAMPILFSEAQQPTARAIVDMVLALLVLLQRPFVLRVLVGIVAIQLGIDFHLLDLNIPPAELRQPPPEVQLEMLRRQVQARLRARAQAQAQERGQGLGLAWSQVHPPPPPPPQLQSQHHQQQQHQSRAQRRAQRRAQEQERLRQYVHAQKQIQKQEQGQGQVQSQRQGQGQDQGGDDGVSDQGSLNDSDGDAHGASDADGDMIDDSAIIVDANGVATIGPSALPRPALVTSPSVPDSLFDSPRCLSPTTPITAPMPVPLPTQSMVTLAVTTVLAPVASSPITAAVPPLLSPPATNTLTQQRPTSSSRPLQPPQPRQPSLLQLQAEGRSAPQRARPAPTQTSSSLDQAIADATDAIDGWASRPWKSRTCGSAHWSRFTREFEMLSSELGDDLISCNSPANAADYLSDPTSSILPASYPFCLDPKVASMTRQGCVQLLPDRHICDHLVRNYMSSVETIFRMYHVPTMESEIDAFWDDPDLMHPQWLAQYLALLALGLRVGDDAATQAVQRTHAQLQSMLYRGAQWALLAAEFTDRASVEVVRTLCMLVLAKQLEPLTPRRHSESTVALVAVALRAAMTINLHEQTPGNTFASHLDAEIGRRLWATVAAIELKQAAITGLPPLIDPGADFSLAPPLNINDADLAAFRDPPISRPDTVYTETAPLRIHALASATAAALLKAVNSAARHRVEYMQVLDYDRRVRELRELRRRLDLASAPANSAKGADGVYHHLPLMALDVFFNRLLLALHAYHAQQPGARLLYP
ncbi:hypothetical protein KEM52_006257 [Ascosphaera acerosa]|nr:hypothetical protein KEM52_006257 [Ascosphaera acerosa]